MFKSFPASSLFFFIAVCMAFPTQAQVGIGIPPSQVNPSAQLDVSSTNKGFLPPRLGTAQRDSIQNPANGLVIFCTNAGVDGELEVYLRNSWKNMIGGAADTSKPRIGQTYGGGIIFYLLQSGDPGYDPNVYHGLIAATANQSSGTAWNNGANTITNATGNGIGAGKMNTATIIASQGSGNYAAQICVNYQGGGYKDWYLPSVYELNLLYLNKSVISGISNPPFFYWSSTESNYNSGGSGYYNYAIVKSFYNGSEGNGNKGYSYNVRAIRSF